VQSFSELVLSSSRRGYLRSEVYQAAALVHEHGWRLGIQLMLGLPGDTRDRFLASVREAIALEPAFVRLYPTLVLKQTALAGHYLSGDYQPLTLDQAVEWCALAYDELFRVGIPAARMGLQADPVLEQPATILAGPYHPAFGYLVRSAWWRSRIDQALCARERPEKGKLLVIRVGYRSLSEVQGIKRGNLSHWRKEWQLREVAIKGESDWHPARFDCQLL
jgi:histone acetyltransferase (RNA polymerase elongator complex component)